MDICFFESSEIGNKSFAELGQEVIIFFILRPPWMR